MKQNFRTGLLSLYVFANNGLRYLASSLRSAGHETYEFYFNDYVYHHFVPPTPSQMDTLIDQFRQKKIDLLGISLRAGAYLPLCIEITRRVRQELKIPVMWGGMHVTMASDDCIDYPDFLIIGEAEQTICEAVETIAHGQDYTAIENVWLKDEKGIIKNRLRPLCQDLDILPYPDYHSDQFKIWFRNGKVFQGEPLLNERIYLMINSRGCNYNCSFCNVSRIRELYGPGQKYYRHRSVESCIGELVYAKSILKKLHRIRFDDQMFVQDNDWIAHFCHEYPKKVGITFEILSDPRFYDDWSLKTLAQAGMDKVVVGVQGASGTNRRLYKRKASDDKLMKIANAIQQHGLHGVFQVIVDDPETQKEEKFELLELLLRLPRPYSLYIFSLCHWPNTTRTKDLVKKGLISIDQVEGHYPKALHQFLADFTYNRPAVDNFFLALYQLCNKRLVPKWLIRRLATSKRLMQRPGPVIALARVTSLLKLVSDGMKMLVNNEISLNTLRSRWVHFFDSPSV